MGIAATQEFLVTVGIPGQQEILGELEHLDTLGILVLHRQVATLGTVASVDILDTPVSVGIRDTLGRGSVVTPGTLELPVTPVTLELVAIPAIRESVAIQDTAEAAYLVTQVTVELLLVATVGTRGPRQQAVTPGTVVYLVTLVTLVTQELEHLAIVGTVDIPATQESAVTVDTLESVAIQDTVVPQAVLEERALLAIVVTPVLLQQAVTQDTLAYQDTADTPV